MMASLVTMAQTLTARVSPSQVEVGQRVQLTYTLNTLDADRIHLDDEITGFEVLYGPTISQNIGVSIGNGNMSKSASVTYTYLLRATKEGTYTLPSASLTSNGKKVKSNAPRIQVLPASGNTQGGQSAQRGSQSGQRGQMPSSSSGRFHTPSTSERIDPKDIYFTVTASKKHVFEQEAILLTYKLYSLYSIDQIMGEIPQLDGFHTQEIELPKQRSFTMERVGNRNFGTVVWRQYVLFPQKAGKLTIPAIDYQVQLIVQEQSDDIFEAFFGGGSMTYRIDKTIKAPAVEIQVDPLPTKPANFSGAVGKGFTVSGKLGPEQVDANDATALTLTVKGTGNLQLISAPQVAWPKDFESYDAKTTENTKLSTAGLTGTITYEYQAVPHHAGKYDIPPVVFCYFDTESRQYKTIKTDAFKLGVAPGMGRGNQGSRQEDVRELGDDIHYIKTGKVRLSKDNMKLWGSMTQMLAYGVLFVLFLVVLILFRRQAQANANLVMQRGRKAGKAAAKRLKIASKLLKAGDQSAFYDEVMRALWGYVADKLNLPVTDLTKDNVSEKLQARNVDEQSIQQFLDVLGDCEFARFAPGDPATNMDNLFNKATEVINLLDNQL